jgi:hypothetical protein
MPLHSSVTRVLTSFALLLALGSCASAAPTPTADAPGAIVADALARVAAKDLDALRSLACAGQEDLIRNQIALPADIGMDLLPGVDTNAMLDAVQVDVSGVKVGEPTVDADVAEVPVTGAMNVTFDKEAMRPLLRSMLEARGTTMTDDQVDGLLSTLQSYGQQLPIEQTIRLVRESGAWKVCQAALEAPATP